MDDALLDKLEDMGAEVDDTLDRLMGDEEMYLQYLHQFPQNANIVALRKAVDAGDCETAMREVHTLKGVALNLGLLPFVDACMDMLLDFRAGENDAALSKIDEVEGEFKTWADAIRGA